MKIRDPDSMRLHSQSFHSNYSSYSVDFPVEQSPSRNRVSRSRTLPVEATRPEVENRRSETESTDNHYRFRFQSVITNERQIGFSAADWSSNFNVRKRPFLESKILKNKFHQSESWILNRIEKHKLRVLIGSSQF